MSKRMLQSGRYPKVSQTQQHGRNQVSNWTPAPPPPPPLQQGGIIHSTSDANFYSIQQSQLPNQPFVQNGQSPLLPGHWAPNESISHPQPLQQQQHQQSPTHAHSTSNWQGGTTYTYNQVNQNDPWSWNIDNDERNISQHYQNWQESNTWKVQQQLPHPPQSVDTNMEQPQQYSQHQLQHQGNVGATESYFQVQEAASTTEHVATQQPWRYGMSDQPFPQNEEQKLPENWSYEGAQQQPYSNDQYLWSSNTYNSDNWYHQQQPKEPHPTGDLQQNSNQPNMNINSTWDIQEWEQWPTSSSQDRQKENHSLADEHSSNVSVSSTSLELKNKYSASTDNTNIQPDADIATDLLSNKSVENVSTSDIINDNVQNQPNIVSEKVDECSVIEESAVHDSGGGLSAFFSSDIQDNATISETVNNCVKLAQTEPFSQEGVLTSIQEDSISSSVECHEHDKNNIRGEGGVDTTFTDNVSTSEENVEQQRNEFLQSEEDTLSLSQHRMEVNLLNTESCLEEPVNQEVPEPPPKSTLSPQLHSTTWSLQASQQRGREYEEELPRATPEEPVNQQVPENSLGALSHVDCISSPQHDRVIIRAREGSPFKPPSKQSSVRGLVVQQESSSESVSTPAVPSESTAQDVNLETVPDNLERLPDAEVLEQHSSWHSSFHRQHGREQYNGSPSTTLWDSPDIPSVTLAPAAPPFPLSPTHISDKNQGNIHQESKTKMTLSQSESDDNTFALRQSPMGREELQTTLYPPLSTKQGQPLTKNNDQSVLMTSTVPGPPPPPAKALELLQKTSQGSKSISQAIKTSRNVSPLQDVPSQSQLPSTSVNKTDVLSEINPSIVNIIPSHQTLPPPSNLITEIDKCKEEFLATVKSKENTDNSKDVPKEHNMPFDRNSFTGHRTRDERFHSAQDNSEWWSKDNQRYPVHEGVPKGSRSFPSDMDGSPFRSYKSDAREHWDKRHESRHFYDDRKYSGFDERSYFIEQDRSRPSSRTSVNESVDGHERYLREKDYRRHYYPERESTPSRFSETDASSKQRDRPSDHYESDSYDERHQRSYRKDDYFNRPRNYSGYGYDSYRSSRHPYYSYYDPYNYCYNSYSYGFYDELYRYNQHLEEQYQQYHAAYSADYEKLSIHSGRSSTNDELQKNSQSLKYSRDVDQNSVGGSDYSAYNQQYLGSYGDDSGDPSRVIMDQDTTIDPTVRLTPAKFACPHTIAAFSQNGLLIKVVPVQAMSSQPAAVEIHNLQQILVDNAYQELKNYPGPLIRGKTHKNDIIQFCQKRILEIKDKAEVPDRDSCILLWELMILLLRQNGSVAGSDIAELLLKDHEVLRPPVLLPRVAADTPQSDGVLPDLNDPATQTSSGDTPSPDEGIVVTQDRSVLNSQSLSMERVTRKFREFLLFGHKKDALEWAMKHALWGHALFLASKMDSRTYANVMIRFANSLALNDPLQTLYQLMSGRQPSAVTCVADEKWGDWRPHLAMVLSNPSTRPEVDARSITTLGDTLAFRGCLYAAHFCYLMAQVEFGSYSSKSSKIVLLGSHHLNSFEEFATNEAIQFSEIYEYAQSLANPDYMLPHLQAYKFIYATRLAEYGFSQEALHYCEIISYAFQKMHGLFPFGLISQVYELANKLKYYDPHFTQGHGEFEELGDPVWLLNLRNHAQALNDNKLKPSDFALLDSGTSAAGDLSNDAVNESIAYVPYENNNYEPSADIQQCYNQQSNYQGYSWANEGVEEKVSNCQNGHDTTDFSHPQQYGHYQPNLNQWELGNEQKNKDSGNTESHVHGIAQPQPSTDSFDYYGASTQLGHSNRHQPREHHDSISSDGIYKDRRDSTLSTSSGHSFKTHSGSIPPTASSPTQLGKKMHEDNKVTEKKDDKTKTSGSWLNGIFSRILPKAPNQMILPDDKNPTIIWDPAKKKWVNTEDDENGDSGKTFAPPTDMELMTNQSSSSFGSSPPPPPPATGHNRFQRPKSKGMRQNYVDVLNPGNTKKTIGPAPEVLFPTVEASASSEMKFFSPSSIPDPEDRIADPVISAQPLVGVSQTDEHNSAATQMPLMLDPAEFASSRSNVDNHRSGSAILNRRAYPT